MQSKNQSKHLTSKLPLSRVFIPFAFEAAARRPGRETDERRLLRDSANTRRQQRGSLKGEGYSMVRRLLYHTIQNNTSRHIPSLKNPPL